MTTNDTHNKWQQLRVVHCPIKECHGMLLQSPYQHYEKCSDCNKYFMQISEYKEIKVETNG